MSANLRVDVWYKTYRSDVDALWSLDKGDNLRLTRDLARLVYCDDLSRSALCRARGGAWFQDCCTRRLYSDCLGAWRQGVCSFTNVENVETTLELAF